MFCPNCGFNNPDDSRFCMQCASKLFVQRATLGEMMDGDETIDADLPAVDKVVVEEGAQNVHVANEQDFVIENGELKAYNGRSGVVVIPDSVTKIRENALAGNGRIKKLVLPDSISFVSDFSFMNCGGITDIQFGHGVARIGREAFRGCTSLETLEFPTSMHKLDDYAFFGCSNLRKVVIPDGVTGVGYKAFADCPNVTIYCMAKKQPKTWDKDWDYDLKGKQIIFNAAKKM